MEIAVSVENDEMEAAIRTATRAARRLMILAFDGNEEEENGDLALIDLLGLEQCCTPPDGIRPTEPRIVFERRSSDLVCNWLRKLRDALSDVSDRSQTLWVESTLASCGWQGTMETYKTDGIEFLLALFSTED